MAQFLSNASKSLSGTLADILSPARMIIFGTLLTTINKPMFALSGYVFASFGTVVCLYWVTFAKVFDRMSKGVREAPGKALIGELAAESGDKTEGAFGAHLRTSCHHLCTAMKAAMGSKPCMHHFPDAYVLSHYHPYVICPCVLTKHDSCCQTSHGT